MEQKSQAEMLINSKVAEGLEEIILKAIEQGDFFTINSACGCAFYGGFRRSACETGS
ncbi:hypothetical protein ACTQ4Q_06710 [Bacillota bacterium LCP21S3_D9]